MITEQALKDSAEASARVAKVLSRAAEVGLAGVVTEDVAYDIVRALSVLDDSSFATAINSYFQ